MDQSICYVHNLQYSIARSNYNATAALGTPAVSTRDQRMKYHGRENQRTKGTSVVGAMRPSAREEKAGRKRGGPAESKPLSHGITGLLQA